MSAEPAFAPEHRSLLEDLIVRGSIGWHPRAHNGEPDAIRAALAEIERLRAELDAEQNMHADVPVFTIEPDRSIRFLYRNWRDEVTLRHVHPIGGETTLEITWRSAPPYHHEAQWLFDAWDIPKGAYRTFALCCVVAPAAIPAASPSPASAAAVDAPSPGDTRPRSPSS